MYIDLGLDSRTDVSKMYVFFVGFIMILSGVVYYAALVIEIIRALLFLFLQIREALIRKYIDITITETTTIVCIMKLSKAKTKATGTSV